jgi:hypothetical protein
LLDLLHRVGNPVRVADLLEIEPPEFYAMFHGDIEMPPAIQKAVASALKHDDVIEKARKKKNVPRAAPVPGLIAELIAKHRGHMGEAAAALGWRTPGTMMKYADPVEYPFDAQMEAKVRAALNGSPVQYAATSYDKGATGFAFIDCKGDKFGAVVDAGTAMGGEWVWRKNKSGNWSALMYLPDKNKMAAFKAVASLVAEVVTP